MPASTTVSVPAVVAVPRVRPQAPSPGSWSRPNHHHVVVSDIGPTSCPRPESWSGRCCAEEGRGVSVPASSSVGSPVESTVSELEAGAQSFTYPPPDSLVVAEDEVVGAVVELALLLRP